VSLRGAADLLKRILAVLCRPSRNLPANLKASKVSEGSTRCDTHSTSQVVLRRCIRQGTSVVGVTGAVAEDCKTGASPFRLGDYSSAGDWRFERRCVSRRKKPPKDMRRVEEIDRPRVNRSRSVSKASADEYRSAGCFSRQLRMIVSRAFGMS